ncbi:MAG TPA: hypothetical protein VGB13_05230 [Candidatus Krumholzibacteria bacterium]
MTTIGTTKPLPAGMKLLSLAICGCCTEESTWGLILAELERLERVEYKRDDDLAAVVVDHCGLSEHGVSIRGGWLTDRGKEALAFLREYGIDWRDKGLFVDDEGVHHGSDTR